jgi:serralysin
VRVFSGRNGAELRSFLAYPAAFRGGVRVASGDVNGDGLADIVTGTGPGTPAQVKVFSGVDASELSSFLAFDPGFVGGVFVASGDVNGDGVAEIITGAGAGGGPHVKVFSGANGSVVHDFQAFAERAKGGVRVACTDVNRDGRPDIVVGLAPRVSAEVRAFDGRTLTQLQSVLVFERGPRGVFVGG